MKKQLLIVCMLVFGSLAPLLGFQVNIPDEIPSYRNLIVKLTQVEGEEPLSEARLYFQEEAKPSPSYVEFEEREDAWYTMVPYGYLTGDEFIYHVQVRTEGGTVIRDPQIGTKRARLLKDENAPELTLVSPEVTSLIPGEEQLVVFRIRDESTVRDFAVSIDGNEIGKAMVYKDLLSFLVTPEGPEGETANVVVKVVDRYGNAADLLFTFELSAQKRPWFSANADYVANMGVTYALRMGESANTVVLEDLLSDMDHQVDLNYTLGGEAQVSLGPVAVELGVTLADDISVFDITEAYPNSWIADYQNIMNLLHPWNFADEFDYSGEEARKFYNSNEFVAKISFFDPYLSYTFGDQKVAYQTQTVDNFSLRGSTLMIELPFLHLGISKGLGTLGLYEAAWPQNFFGFTFGFDVKDVWWFQTNLAFISSLQGRYDNLVSSGTSPIGTLYNLGSVNPEENFVLGLGTGVDHDFVHFSTDFALTLYVDDASQIIDKDKLVTDIKDGFGFDLTKYVGYLDTISNVFPVLDYFPFSLGLAVDAVNKELWGITFGAALELPTLGFDLWYRITDGTFKSLGASVASDEMDWGGRWQTSFKGFSFSAGYEWNKDNIPDILFTHIVPLVKPDLAGTPADPTANDISHITQTATAGIETPFSKLLGNLVCNYSFMYASSNAEALADEVSDDAVASAAILASTENDITASHTGELRWKSGKYSIGGTELSLGVKTKDSYITNVRIDGTADGSTYWEFSYGVGPSLRFSRYSVNLNFDHAWSTLSGSETAYGYDAKLTVSQTFFDSLSFQVGVDQEYLSSDLQAFRIGGSAAIEKRLGILGMGAGLDVSYFDSMTDNTDDSLKMSFEVKGSIEL